MPKSCQDSKLFSPSQKTKIKLRPSQSHCWTKCTASPYYLLAHADKIKDEETSYAAEGTLAHDKGADAILMGWDAKDFDSSEMAEYVKGYVDFCTNQVEKGDKLVIEETIPLFYDDNMTGTTDCGIIRVQDSKIVLVRINDLKYGIGVSVEARRNTQLATYAMSLIDKVLKENTKLSIDDSTLITAAIYQPRIVGEKPIRLWALNYGELKAFCREEIYAKKEQIMDAKSWDDVEFVPGEKQCRFCPGKDRELGCTHYLASLFDEVPNAVETLSKPTNGEAKTLALPGVATVTLDQAATIVRSKKELVKWINELEEHIKEQVQRGVKVPGLKLVMGREGKRAFADEKKASRFLTPFIPHKDRYKKTLISPTQAEKYVKGKLGKEEFAKFGEKLKKQITRSPGSPTVAPESDKRESITISIEEEFAFAKEETNLLD